MADYYRALISEIVKTKPSKSEISHLKLRLCKMHGLDAIPTDIMVLLKARPKERSIVEQYLQTKPGRSLSGVSVVAVMTSPSKCPHGKCITCPGGPGSAFGNVPQSYTGQEPATRRAARNRYDPYLQAFNRLEQYVAAGHDPQKVELIIMGGTFMARPKAYRDRFVTLCFKAMNDFSTRFYPGGKISLERFRRFFELPGNLDDKAREARIRKRAQSIRGASSLEPEQTRNERAYIRCVGLTIETRSDHADLRQGNEMLRLGCTRVELGLQSVYDEALKKMDRGHTALDSMNSIRTLKDLGFKINIHYMPGLFVSKRQDLAGMRQLFADPSYRPDMLKLYPCMVMRGTKLYSLWKKGKYKPLSTKDAVELIAEFKRSVPEYCRIMRVQRDIPTHATSAGVDMTNLRQVIQAHMTRKGYKCRCIRCREIGSRPAVSTRIHILEYKASEGTELFISCESVDRIAGFLRLRFPSQSLRPEMTSTTAIVRELHVYGPQAGLKSEGRVQHRGIGKSLLGTAERIAKLHGKDRLLVISGIGVREYYRRNGYRNEGPYMKKDL
jgi:elongator complex protein 3